MELWAVGAGNILFFLWLGAVVLREIALFVYVAGETEDDALCLAEGLLQSGLGVVSDILGEAVRDHEDAKNAAITYVDHIFALKELQKKYPDQHVAISIKLSQLGAQINLEEAKRHAGWILKHAQACGIGFQIDMEGQGTLENMVAVVKQLSAISKEFYVALAANYSQSMEILYECAGYYPMKGLRIVKGAYRGDIRGRIQIERNYLALVGAAAEHDLEVILGTHNERLVRLAKKLCPAAAVHMLLGVHVHAPKDAVYMPWGSEQGKYFTRRLKEGIRPRVLLLFLRNIFQARNWRIELEQNTQS